MKDVLISALICCPSCSAIDFRAAGYARNYPEVHERLSEEELLAYAGQFDGTICGDDRYAPRYPGLPTAPESHFQVGYWHRFHRPGSAAEFGVAVRNTPNAFTVPVAESVLGYMLSFARRFGAMDSAMKSGEWEKIPGYTLSEKTLGVVGVGNVGKAVLRRARAFGMKLLGNDIIEIAPDFLLENSVESVPLRDLLERADFVSLNCSLTPSSFHLMNAESFGWAKPGAVLINTSRGPVVEEPALVGALQSGRLAGAALDVFEVEPLPVESPLRGMENVLLAPHNSNSSPYYWERVHWNSIRNLAQSLGFPVGDIASLKALEGQD